MEVIDEDFNNSNDQVIDDFTHLPKRILNLEVQRSAENPAAADNDGGESGRKPILKQ